MDLHDFPRDLRQVHRKELRRRRLQDVDLTPTSAVWLSVLALFSGLKGMGGCFVQVPIRALELVLGAGESTIQATNAFLEGEGLIERFVQRVEVSWVDDEGRRHVEADVWAKTRITRRGHQRLLSLGEKRSLVVMAGRQNGRRLVVTGLLGELLRTCGSLLRMLARRVAGANENETPPLRGNTRQEEEPVEGAPASAGARVSSTAATGPPSRTHGPSPPDAGRGGSMRNGWAYQQAEIVRLKSIGGLSASLAYRDLYFNGDRMQRRTLEQHFRELYQAELHRWWVATSTPLQRQVLNMRLAEDAELLEAFEAAEPPESEKRFRYHNYGERWLPTGRGVPGGRWEKAPVWAIEDLKKEQALQRELGELEPKKPRRPRAKR